MDVQREKGVLCTCMVMNIMGEMELSELRYVIFCSIPVTVINLRCYSNIKLLKDDLFSVLIQFSCMMQFKPVCMEVTTLLSSDWLGLSLLAPCVRETLCDAYMISEGSHYGDACMSIRQSSHSLNFSLLGSFGWGDSPGSQVP